MTAAGYAAAAVVAAGVIALLVRAGALYEPVPDGWFERAALDRWVRQIAAVRAHKPGDTITVTYTRNGQQRTASVTLGSSN